MTFLETIALLIKYRVKFHASERGIQLVTLIPDGYGCRDIEEINYSSLTEPQLIELITRRGITHNYTIGT